MKQIEEILDRLDARNELRFKEIQGYLLRLSSRGYDSSEKMKNVHEDVVATKLNVKDIHIRLDGLATTVDRHDSELMKLKRVVGA